MNLESADPRTKSMEPVEECTCKYCDFIRRILIPEMVHDRYFCEPGSREFVEFDSVDVEHFDRKSSRKNMLYRVTARVKFSGVTCSFPLIIKLPKPHTDYLPPGPFMNEEMFYSKMTLNYGTDAVPKCYLSDLGRYDQAAIALEDLTARAYTQVDDKLDEDHLKLCMKALAAFHGRGLKLKAYEFPVFREFYAKLFRTPEVQSGHPGYLDSLPASYSALPVEEDLAEKIRRKREMKIRLQLNDFWTICHGNFTRKNLLFRYENGKPNDVKVIDWTTMRYCSPSIDFGHILFENLPDDDNDLSKVEAFCRNILQIYLDAVKDEYPEVECDLLERYIIHTLPFAYDMIEDRMHKREGIMLRALDRLGSFD